MRKWGEPSWKHLFNWDSEPFAWVVCIMVTIAMVTLMVSVCGGAH